MADHGTLDAMHDAIKEADKKNMPAYAIDHNAYYWILDNTIIHCDEQQFVYECKNCGKTMECYYCEFDYSIKHDCEETE
jgi:hypothetical protein